MKRAAIILLFGVIGLIYVFGVPFIGDLIWSGDGFQHHGEDEANRQIEAYVFLGGALFFALWAWIGSVSAHNPRKAGLMIVGVILATVVTFFCSRLLTARLESFGDWRFLETFLFLWAAFSAVVAYFVGRLSPRPHPKS
jgi:uncharacterized membrane protein